MTEKDIILKLNDHDHEIGSLKQRVGKSEENQKALTDLIRGVDKLANSMDNMAREQKAQGARLERLEQEPVDNYKYFKRTIISSIATLILGGLIGAIFAAILK